MKHFTKLLIASLLGSAAVGSPAFAATGGKSVASDTATIGSTWEKPHVGLIGGSSLNANQSQSTLGLDVGFQPLPPLSVGAEVLSWNQTDNSSKGFLTQVSGTYNFSENMGILKYSYLGLFTGPMFIGDGAKLTGGPVFGFDIPMPIFPHADGQKALSLGLALKHTIIEGSLEDATSLNGLVKYWF